MMNRISGKKELLEEIGIAQGSLPCDLIKVGILVGFVKRIA
jgi:hypothetical protein